VSIVVNKLVSGASGGSRPLLIDFCDVLDEYCSQLSTSIQTKVGVIYYNTPYQRISTARIHHQSNFSQAYGDKNYKNSISIVLTDEYELVC